MLEHRFFPTIKTRSIRSIGDKVRAERESGRRRDRRRAHARQHPAPGSLSYPLPLPHRGALFLLPNLWYSCPVPPPPLQPCRSAVRFGVGGSYRCAGLSALRCASPPGERLLVGPSRRWVRHLAWVCVPCAGWAVCSVWLLSGALDPDTCPVCICPARSRLVPHFPRHSTRLVVQQGVVVPRATSSGPPSPSPLARSLTAPTTRVRRTCTSSP